MNLLSHQRLAHSKSARSYFCFVFPSFISAMCIRSHLTPTISGRERGREATRTVRIALRCMGMLDAASFSHAAAPLSRAFNDRSQACVMIWSAATHGEEPAASPARRRRALTGTGTRQSNAAFSGRARHNEVMRAVRTALRCNALLGSVVGRRVPLISLLPKRIRLANIL